MEVISSEELLPDRHNKPESKLSEEEDKDRDAKGLTLE